MIRGGSAEEISKTIWSQLNSARIRTRNYQNLYLTPPSGKQLYWTIMIFQHFGFFGFFGSEGPVLGPITR